MRTGNGRPSAPITLVFGPVGRTIAQRVCGDGRGFFFEALASCGATGRRGLDG